MAEQIKIDLMIDGKNVTKTFKGVDKVLGKTEKNLKSATSGMTKYIKGIASVAAAYVGLDAVRGVVNDMIDFERAFTEVLTIIPEGVIQNEKLADSLTELSNKYGPSASEQARSFYQVISKGITDATEAMKVLDAANKLSIGGLTSVESAVDILTGIINVYGKEAGTAEQIANKLFATVRVGATRVEELASSLGLVIPTANAMGVSFSEVSGAVAALTTKSVTTSMAVTQLDSIFTAVMKKQETATKILGKNSDAFSIQALRTKGLTKFLQDLYVATGRSEQVLTKLLGRAEGSKAIISLAADNFKNLDDSIGAIKNSSGAANKAFLKMDQTLGVQLTKSFTKVSNLARSTFDVTFGKSMKGIVKWFNSLLDRFNKVTKAVKFNEGLFKTMFKVVLIYAAKAGIAIDKMAIKMYKASKAVKAWALNGKILGRIFGKSLSGGIDKSTKAINDTNNEIKLAQKFIDGLEISLTESATKAVEGIEKEKDARVELNKVVEKQKEVVKKEAERNYWLFGEKVKTLEKYRSKLGTHLNSVKNALEKIGTNQIAVAENVNVKELAILKKAFSEKLISQKNYNDLLEKSNLKLSQAKIDIYKKEGEEADKRNKEAGDKLKKATQHQLGVVNKLIDNPFSYFQLKLDELAIGGEKIFASMGTGIFSMMSKGKEGAKSLIKGAAVALGKSLGGEAGGSIVEKIIGPLMSDPETFSKTITEFFMSIPELLSNIIINALSSPEIFMRAIEGMIESLPLMVDKIMETLVKLISNPNMVMQLSSAIVFAVFKSVGGIAAAIVRGFRDAINGLFVWLKDKVDLIGKLPDKLSVAGDKIKSGAQAAYQWIVGSAKAAGTFLTGAGQKVVLFFENIGSKIKGVFESAASSISDGIKQAWQWVSDKIKSITGSVGDTAGNAWDATKEAVKDAGRWVKDKIPFMAEGGMVPKGFNNDNFPASLTSGEYVIDRSLTSKLNDFLSGNGQGGSSGVTDTLLAQILEKLSEPQIVETSVNVNESAFADIMLDLSRNNARTT
jgi:TP901 family phage tail tape measure protein